jgi:hypothetical protein
MGAVSTYGPNVFQPRAITWVQAGSDKSSDTEFVVGVSHVLTRGTRLIRASNEQQI